MLSKIKSYLTKRLDVIGKKLGFISPNFYTLIALLAGLLSAFFYSRINCIHIISFGVDSKEALLLASIFLLISGIFDGLDGLVARASNKKSNYGAYLDSFSDRIVDGAVFFGIGIGGYVNWEVVFLALFFTLLISYTRAIGSENGVNLSGIGFFERQERTLFLIILSMLAYCTSNLVIFRWGMILFVILSFINLLYRFLYGFFRLRSIQ